MRLKYDFHLHSCLSPCGDEDMTPYNLVNMAKLFELDIIALTDHNTVGNCAAAMEVGKTAGITVVPGMELCTAEEVHVVCLFPDLAKAEAFGAEVRTALPPIKNKPEVFGRQLFMDARDNVLGEEELLLVAASAIPISQVPDLCRRYGGFCYPAHIDRSSFSVLANLGDITRDMGFSFAEISLSGSVDELLRAHPVLEEMRILRSSDAHYLENMREAADTIGLRENSVEALMEYFHERDANFFGKV